MEQRPANRFLVPQIELVQKVGDSPRNTPQLRMLSLGRKLHPQILGAQHGNQGQGYQQGAEQSKRHRQGQLAEQDVGDAAQKRDRNENDNGGKGGGHDGIADFAAAHAGRFFARFARLAMPEGIFHHDDGIIHETAYPQGQPSQGHDVQRKAGKIEQRTGRNQRHRNSQRNDQCAAQIAQEKQQDQHRQQSAFQRVVANRANGPLNKSGSVHQWPDFYSGVVPVDSLDFGANSLGYRRRIGPRLFLYGQADCRLVIDADNLPFVLPGVLDFSYVAQVNRNPSPRCQHQALNLCDALEFSLRPQQQLVAPFVHGPARKIRIFHTNQIDYFIDGKVERLQLLERQIHMNLSPQTAPHFRLRHSGHALDPVLNLLFRQPAQFARPYIAGNGQEHDWKLGQIKLEHDRGFAALRQRPAQPIEPRAQLIGGLVQVSPPFESDHNAALSLRGRRGNFLHPGSASERFLDAPSDERFYLARGDAFVTGHHGDTGKFNVGHQVNRQALKGNSTQQNHDGAGYINCDRTPNGKIR